MTKPIQIPTVANLVHEIRRPYYNFDKSFAFGYGDSDKARNLCGRVLSASEDSALITFSGVIVRLDDNGYALAEVILHDGTRGEIYAKVVDADPIVLVKPLRFFEVNYPNSNPQHSSIIQVFAESAEAAIAKSVEQRPSALLYTGIHGGTFAAGSARIKNIVWDDELGQVHPAPGAFKVELLLDEKILKTFRFTVKEILGEEVQ